MPSEQFEKDIRELMKVTFSKKAFIAVCRTSRDVNDLHWAVGYVYDYWNFVHPHPLAREYMEGIEELIEIANKLPTE